MFKGRNVKMLCHDWLPLPSVREHTGILLTGKSLELKEEKFSDDFR